MEEKQKELIDRAMETSTQWVYFEVADEWYALPVERVRELIQTPEMVKVPKTPNYMLGVINLREATLPVVDLRLRLGIPSLSEARQDMVSMIITRKEDHISWIDSLKETVRTGAEFNKALDPHECAFGKWYDSFKTDDLTLTTLLPKFDAPHKSIHSIGSQVIELCQSGKQEKAEKIIVRTENGSLKEMIKLFDQVVDHLKRAESQVTVITELEHGVIGLLVDKVESVITFDKDEIGLKPQMSAVADTIGEMVIGVARPKIFKDKIIMLLDPEKGLAGEHVQHSASLGVKLRQSLSK